MEIGRLCVKIAGRDATKTGVIIDVIDKNFVLIDGQVRRRKCNIKHLELLPEIIKIRKGAAHAEVVAALKALKIDVKDTKAKPKKEKPLKKRARPVKAEVTEGKKEEKPKKKEEKAAEKKKEEKKKAVKKPDKK